MYLFSFSTFFSPVGTSLNSFIDSSNKGTIHSFGTFEITLQVRMFVTGISYSQEYFCKNKTDSSK